jgi:hypothetical protein
MYELPLDEKTRAFIERTLSQIKSLQDGLQGALSLVIEQNSLEGSWQLDWPNRRLVRTDQPELQKVA